MATDTSYIQNDDYRLLLGGDLTPGEYTMLGGGTTGGPSSSPSAMWPSPSPSADDMPDRSNPSSSHSY